MTRQQTVLVRGQVEVTEVARVLIDHCNAFELRPMKVEGKYVTGYNSTWELIIPLDTPTSTYDFALANR